MNIAPMSMLVFAGTLSNWFVLLAVLAVIATIVTLVAKSGAAKPITLGPGEPSPEPGQPPRQTGDQMFALKPGDAAPSTISDAGAPSNEVLAMIAAVVCVTLGATARVAKVDPSKPKPGAPHSVEITSPHWSMEGRRQIYSSHQIR